MSKRTVTDADDVEITEVSSYLSRIITGLKERSTERTDKTTITITSTS